MSLTKITYSMIQKAPINIVDKGADATGVASSAQALNDAITEAIATNNEVFIPAGTFNMASTTILISSPVRVYGTTNSALIWAANYEGTGISITGVNVYLENFMVITPKRNTQSATSLGIDVTKNGSVFTNVKVKSIGAGTYDGWQTAIRYAEWRHLVFGGEATGNGYGIKSTTYVNALSVFGCFLGAEAGAGAAVYIVAGAQISIIGCDIEGYSDYGVWINGLTSAQCRGVTISGNYFELQKLANIRISGFDASKPAKGVSITGNFLENNGQGGRNILCEYTSGLTITGNECHGGYVDAVLLQISNLNVLVQANDFDTGSALVTSGTVTGIYGFSYSQGTWSPEIDRSSSATTATYTSDGRWTRIGNQVTISGSVTISSIAAQGTGNNYIKNLPFAPTDDYHETGSVFFNTGFLTSTVASCSTLRNYGIVFQANKSATVVAEDWAAGRITFSCTYLVA